MIILDPGHGPRGAGRVDPGAVADLDGDGVVGEAGEREADLVRGYVAQAAAALHRAGHEVLVLGSGPYPERHRQAVDAARARPGERALYVQAHGNAGAGSYGLVLFDGRSLRGGAAARRLARALAVHLAELRDDVRLRALHPGDRGHVCVAGIWSGPSTLCGVVYEPAFLDAPGHASLWSAAGLVRIGAALADGCHDYLRGA